MTSAPHTEPPAPDGRGPSAEAALVGVRRLKLYILSAVYGMTPMLALSVGLGVFGMVPGGQWPLIPAAVCYLVFVALGTWLAGVAARHTRTLLPHSWPALRRPTWIVVGAGVLSAALLLVAVGHRGAVLILLLFGIVLLLGLAPALRWWHLTVAIAVLSVLALTLSVVLNLADGTGVITGLIATGFGLLWFVLATETAWLNGWMLRVVLELEAAREQAAALAIAEERVRISQDLHDTFGRTLASVSLKSELTAQLIARGRLDEAQEQAHAVRQIAQEAAAEVRSVVAGMRGADLRREVEGARALLTSAGIDCTIFWQADPDSFDDPVREALGWAVREAATNVIRHSRATWWRVQVDPSGMLLENDGVTADPDPHGNGLRGMADRLGAVGASATAARQGDTFQVRVRVPAATVAR